ncbi:hypothetical protein RND81_02G050100 [Saponaria officinalis]|uniref:Ternary complex factor MIP1 leucine-zipper domain-containing protein n=1 Tax=Saponaria officinalis TaxID=3572 RepID=A0AAW1MVI6_SAPOF
MRSAEKVDIKKLVCERLEMQRIKSMDARRTAANRRVSSRERKLALLQDVDRLKKKLRHEENVHRALERAFTRPLGTLPRLPPYLPPYTLELLAEVAVLEEEVVRLEEQVVQFRKGLYKEAVNISSSKQTSDLNDPSSMKVTSHDEDNNSVAHLSNPQLENKDDEKGKENQSCTTSVRNKLPSPSQKPQIVRTPVKRPPVEKKISEMRSDTQTLQLDSRMNGQENAEARLPVLQEERKCGNEGPNELSENILKCLLSIFTRMTTSRKTLSMESLPSQSAGEPELIDPYNIGLGFGDKDVGPYKKLCSIDTHSINPKRTANCLFLIRRLKILITKLASLKLQRLTHQGKLAFWINIYNSCMMNAFLEHGIPETPDTVVTLMQKATINVGGQLLSALTIEHFVLRLPYHSKYTFSKGVKNDEMIARSTFGLELSEPLVTFALSCGSWSSPAVRIYTAKNVENELEIAKREYLQAAVSISENNKLIIPKLLDWYQLDFAKDMESLLDWICLQLPNEHRKQALKCVERSKDDPISQTVQIMPYEFSFRYLLRR